MLPFFEKEPDMLPFFEKEPDMLPFFVVFSLLPKVPSLHI